jgi:hypothetical protein
MGRDYDDLEKHKVWCSVCNLNAQPVGDPDFYGSNPPEYWPPHKAKQCFHRPFVLSPLCYYHNKQKRLGEKGKDRWNLRSFDI